MEGATSTPPRGRASASRLPGIALLAVLMMPVPSAAAEDATQPPIQDQPVVTAEDVEAAARPEDSAPIRSRFELDGIAIDFVLDHVHPPEPPAAIGEGDDVVFRFTVSDTASGTPLTGLYPAAWMDLRTTAARTDERTCMKKAETFISGSLFSKAELDLNVYYVLALNEDPTVTVVDPLFGFGGSKLVAIIPLRAPGQDWAMTSDQARVFVSMPDVGQVAVLATESWAVLTNIDVGSRPTRVRLQPDEHYLWVAREAAGPESSQSGVTVVRVDDMAVVARLATGRGANDIAFSDDSRFAFVTNRESGSVTVVDVGALTVTQEIRTGRHPSSIAWSPIAQAVYVAHEGDGSIVAIHGERHEIIARMQADPGLGQLRFAPGGRLGFVVNPAEDVVHIFDSASNRIAQTGDMEDQPDHVAFTDELAYVRHRGSETILMIPLDEMGREGAPVQIVDFPGGDNPPGKMSAPTPADAIVQAPGANAVLVANTTDRSIYFYKEGMAAPMGNFSNYGKGPRALIVVDRSLRARNSPGVYETIARLRRPGPYDVVFFLDAPRLVHCFEVTVAADAELQRRRYAGKIDIVPLLGARTVTVGQPIRMGFQLTDHNTKAPKTGLNDVNVLVYLAPGNWHTRQSAKHDGDGVYTVDFVPPRPGIYYAYVGSTSLGISFSNSQYAVLKALAKDSTQLD